MTTAPIANHGGNGKPPLNLDDLFNQELTDSQLDGRAESLDEAKHFALLAVFEAGCREGATGMRNRAAMIADDLAERAGSASTRARAAAVIATKIRALTVEVTE